MYRIPLPHQSKHAETRLHRLPRLCNKALENYRYDRAKKYWVSFNSGYFKLIALYECNNNNVASKITSWYKLSKNVTGRRQCLPSCVASFVLANKKYHSLIFTPLLIYFAAPFVICYIPGSANGHLKRICVRIWTILREDNAFRTIWHPTPLSYQCF